MPGRARICLVNCDDCRSGSEQKITGLWDTNHITVSFNGFVETVYYGQFSTPVSVASAFADLFSRDYLLTGLRSNARSWGHKRVYPRRRSRLSYDQLRS